MKKLVSFMLVLALCVPVATAALSLDAADANGAYNELLTAFNGTYPDEYAGAFIAGDKLCVLLTERHANTSMKLAQAQRKLLTHVSSAYKNSITFQTAKHSYNDLAAARDTATGLLISKGYSLTFAGINDAKNAVDIGVVPAQHANAAAFARADSALSALPIAIVSEGMQSVLLEETSARYATTAVNVRTGPGTKHDIAGVLHIGDKVERLGAKGKWTRIQYNDMECYVFSKYLTDIDLSALPIYPMIENARVRSATGKKYKTLGRLKKGARVAVKSSVSVDDVEWMEIFFNGRWGYIDAACVDMALVTERAPQATETATGGLSQKP